jgi:hypothetical protein
MIKQALPFRMKQQQQLLSPEMGPFGAVPKAMQL